MLKKRKASLDALRAIEEEPKYSVDYAVTVSLNPRLYELKAEEQLLLTKTKILAILRHNHNKCTIVAEMTEARNIHYHCIMKVAATNKSTNIIKYIHDRLRVAPTWFGKQRCIKQVDNYDKWIKYITKDVFRTNEELEECTTSVINDDYGIVSEDNIGIYYIDYPSPQKSAGEY